MPPSSASVFDDAPETQLVPNRWRSSISISPYDYEWLLWAIPEVMQEWDERGVTQTIFEGYWGYHTEAIENAYEDIDCLVSSGEHAW